MRLVIEYPKLLPDALQRTRAEFEQEARMAMAVKLFEMKRLSSGVAAKLAGTDRVSFLLGLHRYGVAMIDLDEDELLSDVKNA
jgi:predicted HTH domain antitoxin